jgi:AcrR family transcriptional regulator
MGIAERKERERAERKALIIDCTKELILKYGAEAVSMGDIAKRAELSKATLYLYFPGKDLLFQDICNEAAVRFIAYYRSRVRPGISALDALKLYWRCYLDFFCKSDDMILIFNMIRYIAPGYPFIAIDRDEVPAAGAPSYEFFDIIKNLVDQGIAEGTFEPEINSAVFSHTILSLFSLIIENAAESAHPPRAAMKNIFQIMLRGIAREGIARSLLVLGDNSGEEDHA